MDPPLEVYLGPTQHVWEARAQRGTGLAQTSHSKLGQSQDLVTEPSASSSECLSSQLLPCLLVSCRDTKASWDPSGLQDQRAKRWVSGHGKQPLESRAGRNKPLGHGPGPRGRSCRLTPVRTTAARRQPHGDLRSAQTYGHRLCARLQNEHGRTPCPPEACGPAREVGVSMQWLKLCDAIIYERGN